MDIGGGTLDVTAHEILQDGTIQEIHHVTGGAYGGIYVNQNFASLLETIFGIAAMKNYRVSNPADWLRLMNDFEMKKRGRRAFDGKVTRISLPRSFRSFFSEFSPSRFSSCLSGSYRHLGVELYNDEFLCLGPNAMNQLFQPVVSEITNHVAEVLSTSKLKSITHLFMVGGFAESTILQDAMKKLCNSRCKLLTPNYASIAVVQGATMFGQKPSTVSSRIMATTYGFEMFTPFKPDVHPSNKKKICDGIPYCEKIFRVVVRENSTIKVGEKKNFPLRPIYRSQTALSVPFFTSSDPDVKYTTDSTVGSCIGELVVNSPNTSKGTDRTVDIIVYFGGTEIKATGVDKTSGNTAAVYLDFLCKS